MSYTALYRKFRPSGFDEVKGQDQIVTTLRNQIKTWQKFSGLGIVRPDAA